MAAKKSKRGKKRAPERASTQSVGRGKKRPLKKSTRRKSTAGSYGVALDAAQGLEARIAELGKLTRATCDDEQVFRGILELLQDSSQPPELRRAALRTLQAASFSVLAFNARRTEYLAALRKLARDPDLEIRQSVLGILARERDGHVQKLLLEGLEDPDSALVPPEKALQLLSYDIHAEAYPLARKIVKKPPNAEAKREALRLLGADTGSVALFESVLRNKQEDPAHRRLSAAALHTLSPTSLQRYAREIVLDDEEDDEVKATSLTALSQFGAESLGRDEELRAKMATLESSRSAALQHGAQAFLSKYRVE